MKIFLRSFTLLMATFIMIGSVNAQRNEIRIVTKRNPDNSIDFDYEKDGPETATISLIFKELTNSRTPNKTFTVSGYGGNMLKLSPINKEQSISYSYSYQYILGKLKPKLKKDITYLLPYRNGLKTYVIEATELKTKYFGNTEPVDWKSYYFVSDEQEAVSATRRGIVVQIMDNYETTGSDKVHFSNKTNHILIEHADGTIAEYDGFEKGSIICKIGDIVFPGTILGKNIKRENGKFGLAFSVKYLTQENLTVNDGKNLSNIQSHYSYVTPNFFTANGVEILTHGDTYISTKDEKIIQSEMSKKELKKYPANE